MGKLRRIPCRVCNMSAIPTKKSGPKNIKLHSTGGHKIETTPMAEKTINEVDKNVTIIFQPKLS